jgi:hypothetical protein
MQEDAELFLLDDLSSTMPPSISNEDTEAALRFWLTATGFALSARREWGETGVDIIATNPQETVYIEVIGYASSPPKRSRDFFEAFFRAISRIPSGATKCAIAVPSDFAVGLPQRVGHYGNSWQRIGQAFPELEIWLVTIGPPTSVQRRQWNQVTPIVPQPEPEPIP